MAQALRVVPRSSPFDGLEELEWVKAPTLVVGSHDEADPDHPYEVAQAYAERIPDAELVSEEPGQSPLAWRGTRLSRAIDGVPGAARTRAAERMFGSVTALQGSPRLRLQSALQNTCSVRARS